MKKLIYTPEQIPERINLSELQFELKTLSGLSDNELSISLISDGAGEKQQLIVAIPEDADADVVAMALQRHAPNKTDDELVIEQKEESSKPLEQVDVIKDILARLTALEAKK